MRGSVQKKKGKNGRAWYYLVYTLPNGKQKWEKAGTNKHEAERLLAERITQVNRGEWGPIRKITFAEFVERWFAQYAESAVKRSTIETYRALTRTHLLPAFGASFLTRITLEEAQVWVGQLREAGLSPSTIISCITILKEMFKHAVRWGYLRHNPVLDIERPRLPYREMDFLTPDEVRLLLETAQTVSPERYPLILTAVLTGMRRGELVAMKWQNLDWHRRQYFVKETLYRGRFEEPKSERSRRAVNLPPVVCDALWDRYDAQKAAAGAAGVPEDALIFCTPEGQPLNPEALTKTEFPRLLKAAGLRRIRLHDLRHTFTALLIDQGESPKYIQSQLGHSSIQVTLDRYGHLMPDVNEAAAVRLENQIFQPFIRKPLEKTA